MPIMSLVILTSLLLAQANGTITRDPYGVPVIRAATESDAYRLAGYAVAQDRLWQMEESRRLAEGRLAEIEGKQFLASDREVALNGYSLEELQTQIDHLSVDVRNDFAAYAQGVNDWMLEAKSKNQLPHEFADHGIDPAPWTPVDSAAIGVRLLQYFGRMTAGQIRNLAAIKYLKTRPSSKGLELNIFDDLLWENDPSSPTTISKEDETQCPYTFVLTKPDRAVTLKTLGAIPTTNLFELLPGVALASRKASTEVAERLHVPFRTGSYAMVVAPKRSATGVPLLLSAPQMGFTSPAIIHEIALDAPGLKVQGIDVPGVPGVAIGATPQLAWGLTTGVADMEDIYFAKAEGADGYRYGAEVKPLQHEKVTILVKDGDPVTVDRVRTQVGPVVLKTGSGYYFTRRSSCWMSELQSIQALHDLYKAANTAQVDAALSLATVNFNFFYAMRDGNIGYHYTGLIPVRAKGWDPRLPTVLGPDTAWQRMLAYGALPHVSNPKSGLLTNWNNKPVSWWPQGDLPAWGSIQHKSVIDRFLAKPLLSPADLEIAAWGIARTDEDAPAFHAALQSAVTPTLRNFDGRDLDGSYSAAAFRQWLDAVRDELFLGVTGNFLDQTNYRTVVQPSVILKALEGRTKTDFLHGRSTADVVRAAEAKIDFSRRYEAPSIKLDGIDPIPYSNRGSYIQIIELGPTVTGRNVLPPGEAATGDHSVDQVNLSRAWIYKPMTLLVAPSPPLPPARSAGG